MYKILNSDAFIKANGIHIYLVIDKFRPNIHEHRKTIHCLDGKGDNYYFREDLCAQPSIKEIKTKLSGNNDFLQLAQEYDAVEINEDYNLFLNEDE